MFAPNCKTILLVAIFGVAVSAYPFGGRGFGHFGKPRGPYPKDWEDILPEDAKKNLVALYENKEIKWDERRNKFDDIMQGLTQEVKDQLPVPPEYRDLPSEIQKQLKAIKFAPNVTREEKRNKVKALIDSLPAETRKLIKPKHFPFHHGLPKEFEDILGSVVFGKLKAVHENKELSPSEKWANVEAIMNSLPTEVLSKLPLPPHLRVLPEEYQAKIKKIMIDKELTFQQKREQTKEIIKTLPEEIKKLIKVPLPPCLQNLPESIKSAVEKIFRDESLDRGSKFHKIRELLEQLPEETKNSCFSGSSTTPSFDENVEQFF
uniref:DUF148 domain-containing protein n=1 Tax=Rhabditophanes sp. KR3021 TaxID=114890 RepID=A0AC35UGP2_9BILA